MQPSTIIAATRWDRIFSYGLSAPDRPGGWQDKCFT